MTLPDFRLEVYLGRWEFAARHHLTASDAETLSVGELLEAVAATYERVDADHVLTFAGAEEARDRATFTRLVELCDERGIVLFSDEV